MYHFAFALHCVGHVLYGLTCHVRQLKKKSGHAYVAHPDELENLIVTEEVILPKL